METHNATPTTSATDEVKAMARISRVLDSVDQAAADRIASWLYDRYSAGAAVGRVQAVGKIADLLDTLAPDNSEAGR